MCWYGIEPIVAVRLEAARLPHLGASLWRLASCFQEELPKAEVGDVMNKTKLLNRCVGRPQAIVSQKEVNECVDVRVFWQQVDFFTHLTACWVSEKISSCVARRSGTEITFG